jgi:hypothetical protein
MTGRNAAERQEKIRRQKAERKGYKQATRSGGAAKESQKAKRKAQKSKPGVPCG